MASVETSFQIRPATFEDTDAVLELWSTMMAEHERNDSRIRLAEGALSAYRAYAGYHLVNAESHLQVAQIGGRVIGFCLVAISRNLPMFLPARYGYLSDLTVANAWRRRGIGRALVEDAFAWLREQDVNSVQLQYYCFNEAGEQFWRSMGFEAYYTRMWCDLGRQRLTGM